MIPVLSKKESYDLDKDTIEKSNLSDYDLMDNAAKAIAQFFCEKIKNPFCQKVLIVCGKGNNGGDGILTHTYLKKYNVQSKIFLTEEDHCHHDLINKYKISKKYYDTHYHKIDFNYYDWIIDGMFGTGLSGELNEKYKQIIKNINKNKNIISIDIPSGIYADNNTSNCYINSKYVLTLGFPKYAHYLTATNNLNILDIGFIQPLNFTAQLIWKKDILKILKKIVIKSPIHKYSKGYTVISAGSNSYPGAAILASLSAYKTGSGYVNLIFNGNLEIINNLKTQYPDILINQNNKKGEFCLFGPGYKMKKNSKLPDMNHYNSIVCDAGLLNQYTHIDDFPQKSILTPHIDEFNKLFNVNNPLDLVCLREIQKNIIDRIVILKSFNSFIITKDMIYIIDRAPSLLAVAGSGDVLSGILISLLSQGYSRLEASLLGTYLHAEAANCYMKSISKDGMKASELINCIPQAFNKLRENV